MATSLTCSGRRFLFLLPRCRNTSRTYSQRVYKPITFQNDFIDKEFRVLVIPGHTETNEAVEETRQRRSRVPPARYKKMAVHQDWTRQWPAAHTFKWSVVPFPVRMGSVRRSENQGIPPGKYANAELMKIPNFLHLTPPHVRQHCAALRVLCTPWPAALRTEEDCARHFPLEVVTQSFLLDGPSLRDERARKVALLVRLDGLPLDDHARHKFRALVGKRYNGRLGTVTLTSDRCPTRAQNTDYVFYLLSVVYLEAWTREAWEAGITSRDVFTFTWSLSPSARALEQLTRTARDAGQDQVPAYVREVEDIGDLDKVKDVDQYKIGRAHV